MKIYKLTQSDTTRYNTYDSAIVVANNELEAATVNPNGSERLPDWDYYSGWALSLEGVNVEYIGESDPKYTKKQLILSSYNAG